MLCIVGFTANFETYEKYQAMLYDPLILFESLLGGVIGCFCRIVLLAMHQNALEIIFKKKRLMLCHDNGRSSDFSAMKNIWGTLIAEFILIIKLFFCERTKRLKVRKCFRIKEK